ncbi:MAG: hypothetical protein K2N18_05625 [Clostridia bacterium]|nr:hypothetical protein [Clostridia bacterium]
MIRFNGNYSDESLGKNAIRAYRIFLIVGIVGIALATAFIIIGWVFKEYELFVTMCVSLAVAVFLTILSIIYLLYLFKHKPKSYVDLQIDDKMVLFNDGISSKEMPISNVVKVNDLEYAYQIYFSKGSAMKFCICQKDLLVEGSIDDFECIFMDKLVHKK